MEFIPIGSDCSIAYQLSKHNLRTNAYPFDWLRIGNLQNIINCINNNFANYLDINFLETDNKIVNKFPLLDNDWDDNNADHIVVKNTVYNASFPHDFINLSENNYKKVVDKYQRRIDRFMALLVNPNIYCIFIRIDNKKLSRKTIDNFHECIGKYRHKSSYELLSIDCSIIKKYTSWKKDELNWGHILAITLASRNEG
jgi:hypothetical protein